MALVRPTGAGKRRLSIWWPVFTNRNQAPFRLRGVITANGLHGLQSRSRHGAKRHYLFSGTVMDNLRHGRLDATDEEIVAAAKMAGADEFISISKITRQVGEGGGLLSVGQKAVDQHARAILAQPDIPILDENDEFIDTLTEALISAAWNI